MKVKVSAFFNLLALLFHLAISTLTQMGILTNTNMAQMSAKYDTVFTPAGLTFSIWGLIYLGLISFCFYQLYKAFNNQKTDYSKQLTEKIGYLFIINNISTGLWLLAFLNEYLLISLLLMLIQLSTLILIHLRIYTNNSELSFQSKLLIHTPLSIYFGWISIATIANASAFLKSINWNGGLDDSLWVVILISIATLLALFMVFIRKNIVFGFVVLWALYGIVLKRQQVNPIEFKFVIIAAYTAFTVILIGLILSLLNVFKSSKV